MAVREILRMGDPRLLQVSREVETNELGQLSELIEDMWETMHVTDGIGLAAPQIGEFIRLVVFGIESTPRYPEAPAIPPTVLFNPHIEAIGDDRGEGWEGCLSVPGMRGLVSRYDRIKYTGIDAQGNLISREAEGFHARVLQHECDHLDGILYPMRIEDMRYFGFEDELSAAVAEQSEEQEQTLHLVD